MLYGAECWPKKDVMFTKSLVKMCTLCWIYGHTKRDRVRNDDIRDSGSTKPPIEEKLVQHQLRWFRHVQRQPPKAPVCSEILMRYSNRKRKTEVDIRRDSKRRHERMEHIQRFSLE
jgi:hypothetical protein